MTGRREALAVSAALAAYLLVAVSAARTHAPTFDETIYLPVGYGALRTGDYRANTVHPPLAKMIAAAPLLAMSVRFDGRDPAWLEPHAWKFGHRFLYDWNDADRLLIAGRAAVAVLAALLAAGVYLWCRLHWGRTAAAFALFACLSSPEVIAHGGLVTNDLAVACFFFLAVAAAERLFERVGPGRVAAAGLALGAALLSKHSALLLAVILPVMGVLDAWRGGAGQRGRRMARSLGGLLLAAAVAYVVLWGGYRFRFAAAAGPDAEPLAWKPATRASLLAEAARVAADRHLLPEAYAHGLWDLAARAQSRRAFLLGELSTDGWWYYFPVAFALKMPLPFLLLLGLAPAAVRGRASPFVWVPAAVFVAASLTTSVNIGVRYLLPVLPFFFVAAGVAAARLADRGRGGRIVLGALGAWMLAGALGHYPHHLAFFNEAAGGPYGGYRYLADSNVDWGQDLKRLTDYVRAHGLAKVKLSYFGTAAPAEYGLPHELLPSVMRPFPEQFSLHVRPGDLLAVSATNLQGVYFPRAVRQLMDTLRATPPLARIGPSIFLYRADFHWLLRPGLAEELGWLPQAMASYRECLETDPGHRAEAADFLSGAERRLAAPPPEAGGDESEDAVLAPADGLR